MAITHPAYDREPSHPASLAIRSCYAHHAEHAGYRQILRYTRPVLEFGLDERGSAQPNRLLRRYLWLHEFSAWRAVRRTPVDVAHVLYAEEYYRFLAFLLPRIPVVLTFHQPADVLERELTHGDPMGRVAGLTHLLTRSRFRKAAAAIITSESQFSPLSRFMPAERIHHIPLGASIAELTAIASRLPATDARSCILTVGNWRRDWRFYFDFVGRCAVEVPTWRFTLVNRRLPGEWAARMNDFPNLTYKPSVTDEELYMLYHTAAVQFLPFEAAAGNNSVNEGLAFGCPVVTNAPPGAELQGNFYRTIDLTFADVRNAVAAFLALRGAERDRLIDDAREAVWRRDWSRVAERTMDVYRSVL